MGLAVVNFLFECLMLFFEFREVRLHRHQSCLLNQLASKKHISVAQTQLKSDGIPAEKAGQLEPKSLIGWDFIGA